MVVGAGHRAGQHGDRSLRPVPWGAVVKRPTVGDEMVLVRRRGDRASVRVTKVGRKYFYIDAHGGQRFSIETGWDDGGWGTRVVDQASLDDEARREQLTAQLRGLGVELGYRGAARRLSTDQLAEILAIVEAAMS
jgi:hypothetical protein